MTTADVLRRITDTGVVPVVRVGSMDAALRAADALLDGGIAVLEITLTVPNALAVVRSLTARFGDRALIGAGTVLCARDAVASIDAGARFVVSPGLHAPTVEAARRLDVPAIPGALTPTEIIAAVEMGCDLVKIFPCSALGGPKYIRALRGPLPAVRLLPTGGITFATVADYIGAGAAAVGIGSELIDEAMLQAGEGARIADRAREFVEAIRAARSKLAPPVTP